MNIGCKRTNQRYSERGLNLNGDGVKGALAFLLRRKQCLFSGFKSKPEAERWGLDFAQQWIDDGKADLHKAWHAPK